jgi:hypothetical protein
MPTTTVSVAVPPAITEQVRAAPTPVIDHRDRATKCEVASHLSPYQHPIQEVAVIELESRLSPYVLGVDDHRDDVVVVIIDETSQWRGR